MFASPSALLLSCLLFLSLLLPSASAQNVANAAVPLRFLVKNRIASVAVERGIEQIVLERQWGNGWKPLAVAYPRAKGWSAVRVATFNLPAGVPTSELRAVGYRGVKFPARFLNGKRSFDRANLAAQEYPILSSTHGTIAVTSGIANAKADQTASTVVESDIWQIVGNQLFFFNQYRGLQLIDLTEPSLPVRTGSLRLPASGEQMFVLDAAGSAAVLLGRSQDKARQGAATLWLIRITDGVPSLIGEVPLEGTITDSRLIGQTLHVLCSVWNSAPSGEWLGESVLTSVDLSQLESPHTLGTLRFPGAQSILQAAEGRLLVSCRRQVQHSSPPDVVHVIDIASAPTLVKSVTTRGYIQDKFKMSIVNQALVTVSLVAQNWGNLQTWVETFPLEGRDVSPLSQMELVAARNESLHATRFDGDRLYIVTFLNVDPLFIVDLADPAKPQLSSVLEVPGWSTYLMPQGDRLLAVGVESGRVTVSLFDVTDAAKPSLLSRLALGAEHTLSWSEANYDEKAVEYLPDQKRLMVPFQTWAWGGKGGEKAVQVVHVGQDSLSQGPTIQHEFNPRRGSWISDRYVTISGQELLVHPTDDSDKAEVTLPLAWRTDRILPAGDFLIQMEDGTRPNPWMGHALTILGRGPVKSTAKLRLSPASDPDALLDVLDLGPGCLVGSSLQGDQLYLAQWVPANESSPQRLVTRQLDLSALPVFREVARAEHELAELTSRSLHFDGIQALWMDAQTLIWHLPTQPETFWWYGVVQSSLHLSTPFLTNQNGTVISRFSSPAPQPAAVLCPLHVTSTSLTAGQAQTVAVSGDLLTSSQAFAQGGLLYFSYDTQMLPKAMTLPLRTTGQTQVMTPSHLRIPYAPQESRIASWLQVVDFRASTPVLRDPVSIPGRLMSVALADAQGAVILTQSDLLLSKKAPATRVVQACAYDGVTAWQLDSYITATPFHTTYATDTTRLYLARDGTQKGVIGIGYNSSSGRLAQINAWVTNERPDMLHVNRGHLLASSYGNLEVASIHSTSGALQPVASYDTPSHLWMQVNRAAFTSGLDLWIPAGDYGVEFLQHAALTP